MSSKLLQWKGGENNQKAKENSLRQGQGAKVRHITLKWRETVNVLTLILVRYLNKFWIYFQPVSKLDSVIHHNNFSLNSSELFTIIVFVLHFIHFIRYCYFFSILLARRAELFLRNFILDYPRKMFIPPLLKVSYFRF